MEDHSMNGNTYDVVIIGGGVIGSSIARALRNMSAAPCFWKKKRMSAPAHRRQTVLSSMRAMSKDRFFKSKAQCKRKRHDGRFIQRTRF